MGSLRVWRTWTMPPDSDAAVAYAARVLGDFRRRVRRDGWAMPVELEALYALLTATDRQAPPPFDDDAEAADALAVTYEEAARRLSVSLRSLQRLVSSGALPTLDIGGCRRVAVADLAVFVENHRRYA